MVKTFPPVKPPEKAVLNVFANAAERSPKHQAQSFKTAKKAASFFITLKKQKVTVKNFPPFLYVKEIQGLCLGFRKSTERRKITIANGMKEKK